MIRILDIALKDLLQMRRDFKTFLFLIIMPVAFTLLFGYAFGGFSSGGAGDSRLPVGYLDQDGGWVSKALHGLLTDSEVIRLDENTAYTAADLEQLVTDKKLAAAVIVPAGYGRTMVAHDSARLTVFADTNGPSWTTIQAELVAVASQLDSAIQTATVIDEVDGTRIPFDYAFDQTLSKWKDPPISIAETTSSVIPTTSSQTMSLAHTAPGMMLQFAIAGLLTAAQIIVTERKSRTLQRLLTTATSRVDILLGHYLAIFSILFTQFLLLIAFAQLALKINYLRLPAATLLVAFCAALCIAALGLLIGILAQSAEQAVVFSIIPMFVLAGLGGAWVPLEYTGATFQLIGHASPVAWAMDGFENISVRGFGIESVLLPAAVLAGYAVLFFMLAAWRLSAAEEK